MKPKAKKRWKPEYSQEYWAVDLTGGVFVDWYYWHNDYADKGTYKAKNCFRTHTEAMKAAKRVRKALKGE